MTKTDHAAAMKRCKLAKMLQPGGSPQAILAWELGNTDLPAALEMLNLGAELAQALDNGYVHVAKEKAAKFMREWEGQ